MRSLARFVLAIFVPLAVVAVAYMLWSISDRLLYIGPLDRAAFGWSVVIPIWVAAPVAAGFVWGSITRRASVLAGVVVGSVVGAFATFLVWQSVAFPDCGTGAIRTPEEYLGPSLFVGLVVGVGLTVSGLLAAGRARQGRPAHAVAIGATGAVVMGLLAIVVATMTLLGPSCQRPSV